MSKRTLITSLCIMVILSGCCESTKKGELSPVEIDVAMRSLAHGFVEMKKELKGQNTGLVASDAEIVLNIAYAKTDNGKFTIGLAAPIVSGIGGNAGYEKAGGQTNTAGNTITIKFRSLLFNKTTTEKDKEKVTVEGPVDPEFIKKLYAILDANNFQAKESGQTTKESEQTTTTLMKEIDN